MSMSNGNPPVGSGYGLPTDDPDTPAEERRMDRQRDAQDRIGEQDRALPNAPMTPEQRAQEIVVREQGVSSFADAEETDRMERPPSVNDRDQSLDESGNIVSDTVKGAWNTLADTGERDKERR